MCLTSFCILLLGEPGARVVTMEGMCNRYVQNTIGDAAPLEAFYIDPRPRTAYKKWVC